MTASPRISILCAYFERSLVDALVDVASRSGADLHLWALESSWPSVEPYTRGCGRVGKFQAINRLLPWARAADLVLMIDDDVSLPDDFLPRYTAIVTALGASIAQPALAAGSHHSYPITLERPARWARLTNFVETGPVVSMTRAFLDRVAPFPESNPMGWGLESFWEATARRDGSRMAIVDACAVGHRFRPVAALYDTHEASRRMGAFLAENDLGWSPEQQRVDREFPRIPHRRHDYLEQFPPPAEAFAHGRGTDAEDDLPTLWSVASLVRPETAIELGTRQGVSTRTLVHAAKGWGGRVVTVDPDDVRPYLAGVDCEPLWTTGEALYRASDRTTRLLYIDTDPHSYRQTRHWLDTWVACRVEEGGVAVFHDVVAARPSIRVAQAVRDWLREHPRGWRWQEFAGTSGLGLLWRLGDAPDFEGAIASALSRDGPGRHDPAPPGLAFRDAPNALDPPATSTYPDPTSR